MSVVGKLKSLAGFDALKAMIGDLAASKRSLVSQVERLKQRRDELRTLPLPQADFADSIIEYIDARGRMFDANLKHQLEGYITAPLVDLSERNLRIANASRSDFASPNDLVVAENLLALCGEQIKAAVRQSVLSWAWPREVGPTRAERRKELEQIDAEIGRLERQLSELTLAARDAGVELR